LPPGVLEEAVAESSPDGLQYLFDVAKSEVDFQFRIAERLDAKARGLFALAAAIFAAAHDHLLYVAKLAGGSLGLALLATALAIFTRPEKNVKSESLLNWLNDLSTKKTTDLKVSRDAVALYINLMHTRQEGNKWRVRFLWVVQVLCVVAIAISAWELIVALDGLT
jgi:hypothetical protein